jgi:hypothetical protein
MTKRKVSRSLTQLKNRKLGAFFRKKRVQAAVTKKSVSEYLELQSPLVLDHYEKGTRKIPYRHVCGISNRLNIAPAELYELLERVKKPHSRGRIRRK